MSSSTDNRLRNSPEFTRMEALLAPNDYEAVHSVFLAWSYDWVIEPEVYLVINPILWLMQEPSRTEFRAIYETMVSAVITAIEMLNLGFGNPPNDPKKLLMLKRTLAELLPDNERFQNLLEEEELVKVAGHFGELEKEGAHEVDGKDAVKESKVGSPRQKLLGESR
ncbi:hypothetical protein GQ43DRAFT_429956 [Delitschia confertaspora ATCC 74209]|uniref:Uncharacterized protein n=1 Tax=Delitschia confertaspora ATCC 74209 TaxID=1513339 RepID=A0A9P4MXM7_9PLEO|nr:hypothetical protein GQ43DRAFT_429956 [Delitschia confertaspora ATCC 74209]